jgi:hypothetical protein
MRSQPQRRLGKRISALLQLANLLPNGDQGIAEPIQLALGLRFRRFDHESPGHGRAHGGCGEAEVDETLCNVVHSDAA